MKKILLILSILATSITFSQAIISNGAVVNGGPKGEPGTANQNTTVVTTLSELQAASGWISIEGDIDLVNTNVTKTDVYLIDGGGSIVTSGTATLKTVGNSVIDNSILNYQLNWDATSEGNLNTSNLILSPQKWGIIETPNMTGAIIWSNTVARDEAIDNNTRFEKLMADIVLFGGNSLKLNKTDFYIGLSHYDDIIEDTADDPDLIASLLQIPSNFNLIMDSDTYLRQYPHYNYAGALISMQSIKNSSIKGGNLIGERDKHLYRNVMICSVVPDTSPFEIVIRENTVVNTYQIPITISGITSQSVCTEIAAYLSGTLGFVSTAQVYLGGSNWAVYTDNNTEGVTLEVEPSPAQIAAVGSFPFGNNRHELMHGIAIKGGKNITIDGVHISYMNGDGISTVGISTGGNMTFENNSENITVKNCYIDYARRLGVAMNSVENALVRQNIITNSGRNYLVNSGTEPASGVWFEPYRVRDGGTGALTEYSISRNIMVEDNRIFDSETFSIGLYTTYDCTVRNNYVNNTISFSFGEQNRVENNTIDLSKGVIPSDTGITFDSRDDGGWGFTREIPTHNKIHGNTIKGDVSVVSNSQTGIALEGYKTTVSENTIRNMGKEGIRVNVMSDALLLNNMIITDPELDGVDEIGIAYISSNHKNVIIDGGIIDVGGNPLEFNNINGTPDTGYGQVTTNDIVRNVVLKSSSKTSNTVGVLPDDVYLRIVRNVTFENVEFHPRVYMNGSNNENIYFNNCTFYKDFYLNGTGVDFDTIVFANCNFLDDGTTGENIDIESRLPSSNLQIYGCTFEKATGTQSILINENRTSTNTGEMNELKIFNNFYKGGSVTNFITGSMSGSYLYGNIRLSTGTSSQTITLGIGGVANIIN